MELYSPPGKAPNRILVLAGLQHSCLWGNSNLEDYYNSPVI